MRKTIFRFSRATYLDFQATTPTDYRVLDAMLPYLTNQYGNPHSKTHSFGWETEKAVEKARSQIASLINTQPQSIIFTSGATESNNAALKGLYGFYGKQKNHIITTQTEHKCVLDTCRYLEDKGVEVTYLPVDSNGLISLQQLQESIKSNTLCVSVMLVNNEIGVIQNLKEISRICHQRGVYVHSDMAQAIAKIPVDIQDLDIDLGSISAHKLYGPKGIGALYVRRKPRVRLQQIIHGGGQERGLRSGTLAPHLCVGFGKAAEIAQAELPYDIQHVDKLYKRLLNGIKEQIPQIQINGSLEHRYKGNLNVSFAFVEGESLIMAIKQVAVSSGSACTSASLEPSYVLRALGVQEDMAHTSLRIGIGRFTTEKEIDFLLDQLSTAVRKLREMSPLWEMHQEGIDINKIEWTQPH
ncbi:unnamed protein product [Paramecium pentaurelia]|uniref:cysteine desulfurase n=1 Tax=Paramecium pentaurelia TaxID=43138 RepID=A0A8S1XWH2_9CILI|nr:unnamed protein product [Paramecium pentaurelia]